MPPVLFEGEHDGNLLWIDERVKQLVFSLSESQRDKDTWTPTDIVNIEKSLSFTFAVVDNILQKFLRDLFPEIEINTPSIDFWKKSTYLWQHEIQICTSEVCSDNIDLLVVIAHEYWHAIIYELVRQGFLPKAPEMKNQEQFCDILAWYCLKTFHTNFDGVTCEEDYIAWKRIMRIIWNNSEENSINGIKRHAREMRKWLPDYTYDMSHKINIHGTWPQREERFKLWYNCDTGELMKIINQLLSINDCNTYSE